MLSFLFLTSSSCFSRSSRTVSACPFTSLKTSSASDSFCFNPGKSCSSADVSCSNSSRASFARRTASSRARTRWRALYSATPAFSDARFRTSISPRKLVVVLFASRLEVLRAACRVACSPCKALKWCESVRRRSSGVGVWEVDGADGELSLALLVDAERASGGVRAWWSSLRSLSRGVDSASTSSAKRTPR